jgi:hypothetical protein
LSLFYNEIFLAFEHQEHLKLYEKERRRELSWMKIPEVKAKVLLSLQRESYIKAEL